MYKPFQKYKTASFYYISIISSICSMLHRFLNFRFHTSFLHMIFSGSKDILLTEEFLQNHPIKVANTHPSFQPI